jgi:predicted esterase
MTATRRLLTLLTVVLALLPSTAPAQPDDIADVPSVERHAGGDQNKRYFLIGPRKEARAPKDGNGLVVILPGGGGSAEFNPFVRRILKHALPEGYLAAEPVAVKWTEQQEIVWPTQRNAVEKMKFSTEQFVLAVIDDVAGRQKLEPRRVFKLSWPSSGPASYAVALTGKSVTGSFIAMSVFKPELLPPLAGAKGRALYLLHSPEDRVCPFRMAEQASAELGRAGARMKLATYEGGHGWRRAVYPQIRAGIEWLERNAARTRLERGPSSLMYGAPFSLRLAIRQIELATVALEEDARRGQYVWSPATHIAQLARLLSLDDVAHRAMQLLREGGTPEFEMKQATLPTAELLEWFPDYNEGTIIEYIQNCGSHRDPCSSGVAAELPPGHIHRAICQGD